MLGKGTETYKKAAKLFSAYLKEDGTFDRAKLGAHVFQNKSALDALNAILHPAILAEVEKRVKKIRTIGIIDAPLLIETGLYRLCDVVWLVVADEETRIARVMRRNGLTREQAQDRIANQLPDAKKRRFADAVIDNSGSMEALYQKVEAMISRYGEEELWKRQER